MNDKPQEEPRPQSEIPIDNDILLEQLGDLREDCDRQRALDAIYDEYGAVERIGPSTFAVEETWLGFVDGVLTLDSSTWNLEIACDENGPSIVDFDWTPEETIATADSVDDPSKLIPIAEATGIALDELVSLVEGHV
jgi:hypothetical protein